MRALCPTCGCAVWWNQFLGRNDYSAFTHFPVCVMNLNPPLRPFSFAFARAPLRDDARRAFEEADALSADFHAELNREIPHHVAEPMARFDAAVARELAVCNDRDREVLEACEVVSRAGRLDDARFARLQASISEKQMKGERLCELEIAAAHLGAFVSSKKIKDALLRRVLTRWETRRRQFDPAANGKFPIRDVAGNALGVRTIAAHDETGAYSFDLIAPFLDRGASAAQRAALYAGLECREFLAADMKSPHESALIGERMVCARGAIEKGACLGVYGGVLVRDVALNYLRDETYLFGVSMPSARHRAVIDGDNILSRINTTFDYTSEGKPCRHAAEGYNVVSAAFRAELDDGTRVMIPVFFAHRAIAPGEELRLDYGYDQPTISRRFASTPDAAARH